jgi:lactobin A/cerein 7B family class IIb bacteriocin
MTNQLQTTSRHDLEAQIVRRCREDEAFRTEFTADPAAAFNKCLNISADMDELSERELEKVAGGATPTIAVMVVASAYTAGLAALGINAVVEQETNQGW